MQFDLIVIGGGSGGVRAARVAAGFGAKVAIIESRFWGGTCVNVGCVPKKMYHYAGCLPQAFELAEAYGWDLNVGKLDWSQFFRQKETEINRLRGIYAKLLDNSKVTLFEGHAQFVDAHTVAVNEQHLTADKILIATGGKPNLPAIEGVEHCLSSDELFAMDYQPTSLLVVGGGYIACEIASTFHHLGTHIHWMSRSKALKSFDNEMVEFLMQEMAHSGLAFSEGVIPTKVELLASGQKQVSLSDGSDIVVDEILMATGRKPNFEGLGLDVLDIELTEAGLIQVNEDFQTNLEHVYAVGDIIPGPDLTPVALEQGMYLAKLLFDQRPAVRPAYDSIATTIFTHPQYAIVGATEEELIATGHQYAVYSSQFRHLKYSLTTLQHRTQFKLLVDVESDKVMGIHAVGEEVGEIIQGFSTLIQLGVTKQQLDQTIGIHPTLAEELVTMREPSRISS